ncbi:MAG: adenylate/guanylate cyclase domain-containing protein [Pseudomonadota bacterium]
MNIRYNAELIDAFVKAVSQTLQHDLTPPKQAQLRQALLKNLTQTKQATGSPEYKEMTILISDLRGFTAISEQTSAKTLIDILNHYFSRMCEIIYRYGGTVDKFMGDSIMALFGIPNSKPDDLERAIACAVEMQRSMLEVNAQNTEQGHPRLFMGIGINTGQVIAGNLGSELHNEYTVIGDAVNLASRIEAFSLRGQILLSEHSHDLAQDFIECGQANHVLMKGKQLPVRLHELFSTQRPRHLEVPRVEARKSPRISVDFPMRFRLLEKTHVVQDSYEGTAIDLSYHGLQARLPIQLAAMSDLRIELSTSLMNTQSNHIYAKVLRTQAKDTDWLSRMEFTGIDDMGQNAIKQYIDQTIAQRRM